MRCSMPGPPLGIFVKSSLAKFFLLLEAERAVIGRDDLQMVVLESIPQLFLMPFLPQGRRENILGAFEAGRIEVLERQIEILRAGLRIYGKAPIAGFAHFFQSVVATQVHDVHRRACHFSESDGPSRWLRLPPSSAE